MEKPKKIVKTLKVRVKDKHIPLLRFLAFEVNPIWNQANQYTFESYWISQPPVWKSEWDVNNHFVGYKKKQQAKQAQTKLINTILPTHTMQEAIAVHAKSRKQFKKCKLRWRTSFGPRRNLGWVPFKKGSVLWKNGQVRFAGHFFKVWDSDTFSQYEFLSGSFTEDSRGRWYFNVAVEATIVPATGTTSIGIDLGLKTTATCSDGTTLEADWFYQKAQAQRGIAQRAHKKNWVRAIHAKVKNKRKEANHPFTTKLIRKHGAIFMGEVSSTKLVKSKRKGMAKSVLDPAGTTKDHAALCRKGSPTKPRRFHFLLLSERR